MEVVLGLVGDPAKFLFLSFSDCLKDKNQNYNGIAEMTLETFQCVQRVLFIYNRNDPRNILMCTKCFIHLFKYLLIYTHIYLFIQKHMV